MEDESSCSCELNHSYSCSASESAPSLVTWLSPIRCWPPLCSHRPCLSPDRSKQQLLSKPQAMNLEALATMMSIIV
jgi:hypothetical protein